LLFLLSFCEYTVSHWTHFRCQILLSHELVPLRSVGILQDFRCLLVDMCIVKRIIFNLFFLIY
jgi:hypothetical protein